MKNLIGYLAPFVLLAGCSATLEKTEPTDARVKTIGQHTGSLLTDGTYEGFFRRGAEKACGGSKFTVLERTRTPSTMAGMEDLPSSKFYWVVRCDDATLQL